MTAAPAAENVRPAKPSRPVVLLRPVPGTSAIHELWAGTKLLAVCRHLDLADVLVPAGSPSGWWQRWC